MRAKILSSTSSFNGVAYNTNKTQSERGELTRLRNFGYLQDSKDVAPSEVKNFLIAHSNRNSVVKEKQFHAMISCKGREYSKEQLTDIAHEWIDKMGYGNNPFLIVFHKDTDNNHVHIVSSRIDQEGKKINDSYEKVRAQESINEIMRLNPKHEVSKAIELLREYSFSTKAQAFLILERNGYTLRESGDVLNLIKYGKIQDSISLGELSNQIKEFKMDSDRSRQLNGILFKYSKKYYSDPVPTFEPTPSGKEYKHLGYRSDLGDFLKDKFGLVLIFHGKNGQTPYGYSIIDNRNKIIFKGSQVFPMSKFFERVEGRIGYQPRSVPKVPVDLKSEKVKLQSALNDFSTIQEGLKHHSLELKNKEGNPHLVTSSGEIPINEILPKDQVDDLKEFIQQEESNKQAFDLADLIPSINISNDLDDEAVHGRRRNKKRNKGKEKTR